MISINLLNALDISNDVRHFTGTQYFSDTSSQIGLNYIDVDDGKEYCWRWNIHHLAHKCKEWAFWKDYEIITRLRVPDIYRDEHKIDYGYLIKHTNNGIVHESWWIDTEPEAIFKACQWVLDNKDKQ